MAGSWVQGIVNHLGPFYRRWRARIKTNRNVFLISNFGRGIRIQRLGTLFFTRPASVRAEHHGRSKAGG
jgi:hypothetical protein